MSIVLNEYEWAEEAISVRDLGNKPIETLIRVAKYYLANGYSKEDARRMTEEFLTRCDPNASVVIWSQRLDYVMSRAVKCPIIRIDFIPVTEAELAMIAGVPKRQTARLAFTLLCVSKYWDMVNPNNNHWVNERDSDLMRMANVNTSIRRQSAMFSELKELGLIKFSNRVDNLNVQVLFTDSESPHALAVTDLRNLGYRYLKYLGEPYIECTCCGLVVRSDAKTGRKKKYCNVCAARKKIEQDVNAVMKMRASRKEVR